MERETSMTTAILRTLSIFLPNIMMEPAPALPKLVSKVPMVEPRSRVVAEGSNSTAGIGTAEAFVAVVNFMLAVIWVTCDCGGGSAIFFEVGACSCTAGAEMAVISEEGGPGTTTMSTPSSNARAAWTMTAMTMAAAFSLP